jgi:hypothetical protein
MTAIVPILSLWLPVLLSAVVVFLLSTLIHMVLGYHKNDFRKIPDENAFADALRKFNIPPGDYMLPYVTSSKDFKSPEFKEKVTKGPRAVMTIMPGRSLSMTNELLQWFVYLVIVGVFTAYVAGRALPEGAGYLSVFRFAGVTAFCCHAIAGWQASIWYKRPWSVTFRNTVDGLVYALFTAGVFGWLWPR